MGCYEGIDLPDDDCRLVYLTGLPERTHLQECFLAASLRAREALDERTQSRVAQGGGCATCNPMDYAVVLIRGIELTRHFVSPVLRKALDVLPIEVVSSSG